MRTTKSTLRRRWAEGHPYFVPRGLKDWRLAFSIANPFRYPDLQYFAFAS